MSSITFEPHTLNLNGKSLLLHAFVGDGSSARLHLESVATGKCAWSRFEEHLNSSNV